MGRHLQNICALQANRLARHLQNRFQSHFLGFYWFWSINLGESRIKYNIQIYGRLPHHSDVGFSIWSWMYDGNKMADNLYSSSKAYWCQCSSGVSGRYLLSREDPLQVLIFLRSSFSVSVSDLKWSTCPQVF